MTLLELTQAQTETHARFLDYVAEAIVPEADRFDREERIPRALIDQLAERRWLGALAPAAVGGAGFDYVTFGLLNEALNRGCSSVRSLLTVHSMVQQALLRWGTPEQRARYLPRLARGEILGAFALSEPKVGSDAKGTRTEAVPSGDGYRLSGTKRWITFGQIADLFLLFGHVGGNSTAFLVEASSPGLTVRPIGGMLGTRAAMLAELELRDCFVPGSLRVGGVGFGASVVAAHALECGRYSVAWGCVGASQACLDASVGYARGREQFGRPIREYQLVRGMIADMATQLEAARLLCLRAGQLRDADDPRSTSETNMAKYFASSSLAKIASDAVQIHGANGCGPDFPVQRWLRDAKVMEVIEGSTQIQQLLISSYAFERVT